MDSNTSVFSLLKSMIGYSLLAIVSGLSVFFFIAFVNKIIGMSISSNFPKENNFTLIFSVIIAFFFISRRLLSEGIINFSQKIFWDTRKDIVQLVLKAPYQNILKYKDEVFSTLTTDINNITHASILIIDFISSFVLILASLIYMLYISKILFIIGIIIISFGVLIYLILAKIGNNQFRTVRELEQYFIKHFNSILSGIKEINVNPTKGDDIYKRIIPIVEKGKTTNTRAYVNFLNSQLISQLLFYGIIAYILVYSRKQFNIDLDTVINFIFILLFLLGPIVNVMASIPALSRAKVSINKLSELKQELNKLYPSVKQECKKYNYNNFKSVNFKNYTFSFDQNSFSIGPFSFTIYRNDIIFIYGGNGSGKTTLINTLLHLYKIDRGDVYIDDNHISAMEMDCVRNLYSPVFSDFFLFDEFYGIENINIAQIEYYLKLFELDGKVFIKQQKFSSIDLSLGQRKRLALIVAIIENRPILVLDEWAADQDPYFRNKFYKKIIPILKRKGKTIIAITHDDKYYSVADRLFKMEYGQLIEVFMDNKK